VSQHLQALERKGYIHRGKDKSRAIRFLHRPDSLGPSHEESVRSISVRGRVAAGTAPAMASEGPAANYLLDRALFDDPENFLMKVDGACMVDAHILEGDLIVVSPEPSVQSGDVVVARVGGEVSVKRYETRDGSDYLVSQLGPMKIGVDGAQVQIIGKVVGLIRPVC
jgi:repressor LexA